MDTTDGLTQVSVLTADQVVRVRADAPLHEVAQVLQGHDVGAVVVGEDQVEGILSERDVVRAVAEGRDPATTRAGDVATPEVSWCDARTSPVEAAQEMMERYVRHLLVTDDGNLVGIISARDLLGALAAARD